MLIQTHNKAFKRDSCRVAFLDAVGFGGESGVRKVGLCGIHPLTQRYVSGGKYRCSIRKSKDSITFGDDT
ncbi:DUF3265 domain-containing protein [Vibrio vulnificus]|nr:DUF3265 domain-containing protein [Vibrio vulnificus]